MIRSEVRARPVIRQRTTRMASQTQGTATTSPSTQWSGTDVWGMATSNATPVAMASNADDARAGEERPVGPDVDQDLFPRKEMDPADCQMRQPNLPAIDPADRRTEPSAPAAE